MLTTIDETRVKRLGVLKEETKRLIQVVEILQPYESAFPNAGLAYVPV